MASRLAKVATQRRRERRAKAAGSVSTVSTVSVSTASAWTALSDADESRNQSENENDDENNDVNIRRRGRQADVSSVDDSTISSAAWTLNSKSHSTVDAAPPMIIMSPSSKRALISSNSIRFSKEQDAVNIGETSSTASRRRHFARARATTPNPPDRQGTVKADNDKLDAKKKLNEITAKLELIEHEKQNLQLTAKEKDKVIDNLEQLLGLAELELREQKQKTCEAKSREEDFDRLRSELEQLRHERSANEGSFQEFERAMKKDLEKAKGERDKLESDLMQCMERLETKDVKAEVSTRRKFSFLSCLNGA